METGELELLMADRQTYRVVETLMRGAMVKIMAFECCNETLIIRLESWNCLQNDQE